MTRFFAFLLCLSGWLASQAQERVEYSLITRNTGTATMWDGAVIRVFGFTQKLSENTSLPSVTLYANEGDTLVVNVRNISQGDPHTIHPHGMDADQMNDGTPSTSFSIGHMESATYRFHCSHAGTYIYHCHVGDVAHVQMGMYGLVIVRPKDGSKRAWTGGPAYDREYAWLTSEVDKSWHDSVPGNPNHDDSLAHEFFKLPPFVPGYFLVQGKARHQISDDLSMHVTGKVGEKLYLRLANIGFYLNEIILPAGMDATWIASDGRPLPTPIRSDTLRIAPGERYGVMLTPGREAADSIAVRFVNMNTRKVWNTEYIPVKISGYVGIAGEEEKPSLLIYPNPAGEALYVHGGGLPAQPARVTVTDILGRRVLQQQFSAAAAPWKIDVSRLPQGLYQVEVTNNHRTQSRQVLISR